MFFLARHALYARIVYITSMASVRLSIGNVGCCKHIVQQKVEVSAMLGYVDRCLDYLHVEADLDRSIL